MFNQAKEKVYLIGDAAMNEVKEHSVLMSVGAVAGGVTVVATGVTASFVGLKLFGVISLAVASGALVGYGVSKAVSKLTR